ncbi:MAG: diguanylate cyclase [Defluviitaleaceae bacterium]|nr:diguanylate cyclase [Defluviitaleaceae bacterium]
MSNMVRKCILIIDDSPLELRTLSMFLSDAYELKVAKSGQEGIEVAQGGDVDLILVDLNMPDKTGFEVLYELKNLPETAQIPVIMVTGSDSTNDEVRGLGLGAADFIRKPLIEAIVNLRVNMHLQLRDHIQTIEKLSLIDGLTGINNRRSFDNAIKVEWSRSLRKREWLGMLMLDIDFFKKFNDKHGHLNGDACLKAVASTMVDTITRGSDYVFRWGGEEFMAILPDTALEGVIAVAERLRKKISQTPVVCDTEVTFITASLGAGAIIPVDAPPNDKAAQDEFFSQIDKALYRAKSGGRNRVEAI